jgi:hypothetical protein
MPGIEPLVLGTEHIVSGDHAAYLPIVFGTGLGASRAVVEIGAQEHDDPAVGGGLAEVDMRLGDHALQAGIPERVLDRAIPRDSSASKRPLPELETDGTSLKPRRSARKVCSTWT